VIRRAAGPVPAITAAVMTVGLTACNTTTYDASATTAPYVATTVYVATGSTTDLLADIATELSTLSDKLVESDGQGQALTRIQAQWAVARPAIAADRPELLDGFDAVLAQVQRSVERRRPADADKASKNLAVLIAAYEG
jgi:hypothetical protein